MMPSLGCVWNRPRLERLVDGALGPRAGRAATSHAARCARCGGEVERLSRLRLLVRSAEANVADPDWAGFWPAVRVRIAGEARRPVREPWWLPFWKPVWGHPRVALGSVMVSSLAATLVLWPSTPVTVPRAMAAPVVVQDVSTADPDRSVMVYSNPDDDVTVIWVFNAAEQDEQS
jgi:anti-sigma factor RsiW